jgi:O-antigen biosynthesis protein
MIEPIVIQVHGEPEFYRQAQALAGKVAAGHVQWLMVNSDSQAGREKSDSLVCFSKQGNRKVLPHRSSQSQNRIVVRPCRLPVRWLERFLTAIALSGGRQAIQPFWQASPDNSIHSLPPVRAGATVFADAEALDGLCHAFGSISLFTLGETHERDARNQSSADGAQLSYLPADTGSSEAPTSLLFGGMFVADIDAAQALHAPPSALVRPWFALCDQIQDALVGKQRSTLLDDTRPRLLHVLHDWGGGVARFASDYAQHDAHYRHLWLQPSGVHEEQCFGASVILFDPIDQLRLSTCVLTPPINTLDSSHASYQAELARVVQAYQISQVLVSSLIGQSLAALQTGLPTALVFHDFFPLWPALHCDFGDPTRQFDAEELLHDAQFSAPFARQSASAWQALRCAFERALCAANGGLIFPSNSVRDSVLRMAPALNALPHRVIGHGLVPFRVPITDALLVSGAQRAPGKLRVLVPGRLSGGKGAQLLLASLPGVLAHAQLTLLGAGSGAQAFFGQPGVDIISDYTQAELPTLIAQLQPDLALLPRTVAETFSYSLSELFALGVPVLATRNGALAERITEDVTGFLCAATPEALVAALARLAGAPQLLQQVRANIAQLHSPTPATQAAIYADAFVCFSKQVNQQLVCFSKQVNRQVNTEVQAQAVSAHSLTLPQPLDAHTQEAATLAHTRLALAHAQLSAAERALLDTRLRLKQAHEETIVRGNWARRVSDDLAERTRWAGTLQAEAAQLREQVVQAQLAYEAEMSNLLGVITHERAAALAQTQLDQAHIGALSAEAAALAQQLTQAQAYTQSLLSSSSWRVTRPLRGAARAFAGAKSSARFHVQRAKTLLARGFSSLRTRGVATTLARVLGRGTKVHAPLPLALPETPQAFSAYDVQLDVPDPTTPIDVSIIIPVYNKFHYTDTCLRALKAAPSALRVEIIVVDDCSSDETWANLSHIGGIRALQNAQNVGFIGACNAGAAAANGAYLVFLNNDTAVQPGWLDALIATFAQRQDAGLVGAKLVYPDGRLQEAGGIIFRDGSGWNYGRFDAPNDPRYGFVREVDYCSGAAIAIRKGLFEDFGGFDVLYTPAYYEDTDLAFKVRSVGLKCYVQPASVVVHFEGISSGTDVSTGIKRYQVINQQKFLARWARVLKSHPEAPPNAPILRSCQHRAQRHILVVDAVTPMPDQDSGSLRMVNLLRILLEANCAVTFFCEGRHYHTGYAEQLQALGVQVLYHPYLSSEPAWLRENGAVFDAVLLSRHYIAAPLLALVREHCRRARVIFDTVDLHFLREQRQAELAADTALARTAEKTKLQELDVINASDLTLVVSPIEATLLKTLTPAAKVAVLSNIHDIPGRAADFAEREGLLFVGGFQHPPNVDAVLWFVREVLPLCLAQAPTLVLHLIGSKTPPEIMALASQHVIVHGFVADIDPHLARARLSVAPLRYGAGVKGKVNMAMAHGLPVIATPCAVEGMHCQHGVDVLVGATPSEFAAELLRGYHDSALWQSISEGGLNNVRTHFSFEAAKVVIEQVFELSPATQRSPASAKTA